MMATVELIGAGEFTEVTRGRFHGRIWPEARAALKPLIRERMNWLREKKLSPQSVLGNLRRTSEQLFYPTTDEPD